MKALFAMRLGAIVVAFSILGSAGTLKGTIINGTTGQRVAAKQVAILSLSGDMQQIGSTFTGSGGDFQLELAEAKGPILVRVFHQGVSYYRMMDATAGGVELTVYDVTENKPDGIFISTDVQRYQTQGDTLAVSELIVLRNASTPPRTLLNDRSFEIYLPADATVDRSGVQVGNGPPLPASPVPAGAKGHYYFSFPVRPGETRMQIDYRLPYAAEKSISAKAALPVDYFYVALPKSMKFQPSHAGDFQRRMENTEADVQMATKLRPGQEVYFRVSGVGMLPGRQNAPQQEQAGGQPMNRPGGGLGAPIDTPDPIHGVRWRLLAGLCVALAAGGVFVTRRAAVLSARTGEAAKRAVHQSKAASPDPSPRKRQATPVSRGERPPGSGGNTKRAARRQKGASAAGVKIRSK